MERPWSKVTKDTGIGDPREASAEKGARYFKDVTDKIGEVIHDIAVTDVNDFYNS